MVFLETLKVRYQHFMKLTELQCKNAKPKAKPYKMIDGAGLFLLVSIDGGRYWRYNYRYFDKQKTLAIGVYPEVSIQEYAGQIFQYAIATGRAESDPSQVIIGALKTKRVTFWLKLSSAFVNLCNLVSMAKLICPQPLGVNFYSIFIRFYIFQNI